MSLFRLGTPNLPVSLSSGHVSFTTRQTFGLPAAAHDSVTPIAGVTLQINVAPPDVPHAVHVLPHQLRVWAGQVQEILFTLDPLRPSGGRFAEDWDARAPAMNELLTRLVSEYPRARIGVVDSSPEAVAAVARRFFGIDRIPMKDSRGGPLFSYFYGLHDAAHDHVLHMDSDMLFGGGSQTWLDEAGAILHREDDLLLACPHPGPPRHDGHLFYQPDARPEPGSGRAYRFASMSTRVFLIDRRRLEDRVGPLTLAPPRLFRSRVKALIKGNPSVSMPEQILSGAMRRHGLSRLDFLGREPGMWSLHPAYRSPAFYEALPSLIARVEAQEVPDEQRGHYDIVDALFDFTEVRAKLSRSPLRR